MEINIQEIIEAITPFVNPGLIELVAIGEQITTPEGRWEAFQDWLRRNPKWRKSVNKWMQLTPEDAYAKMKGAIIEDSNNPAMIRFFIKKLIGPEMEGRIIRAVGTLQVMYAARKKMKTGVNPQ